MRKLAVSLATIVALSSLTPLAEACTRVLWPTKMGTVVGRNMDWFEPIGTNLWIFPRGIQRTGLMPPSTLTWTSKYGSVVATGYDVTTTDGMNEEGLVANALWLAEAEYGQRDDKRPGLALSLWAQFYLDQFKTVAEAVRFTHSHDFQLVTSAFGTSGRTGAAHLSLADKSGDSAIIEYVAGRPVIYHNRNYTIMTNSPTFDKQLANLKQYKGFGGDKDLPGSNLAADRFVRAAYYQSHLPAPQNERQAIGGVWSVMRNVAAPFGVKPSPTMPNLSATQWTTAADMTNGLYFFGDVLSPTIFWVTLKKVDFKKGAPILKLDVVRNGYNYVGDVTAQFTPSPSFEFMKP